MKNIFYFSIIAISILGCKPEIEEIIASKGTADFTTYVALGNSLTAGYADGALYKSGQLNSYPNMLAQQFAFVGGNGDFKQPLMPNDNGAGVEGKIVKSKYVLVPKPDCKGTVSLSPVNATGDQAGLFTSIKDQGPFNNLGIPAAKSYHLITPLLGKPFDQGGNPFYNRFAQNPGDSTVMDDAMKQKPSFFTLWIGSNDVLLYALYGGEGRDSVTPTPTFNFALNAIVKRLTANGAKGAIANLPGITDIPYFTTVPYNALVLTDEGQVSQLNAGYAKLGIKFSIGPNPFIIQDRVSGYPRQVKANELVLLSIPQDSIRCFGWGSSKPIPHTYILDEFEIDKIKTATSEYNGIIAGLAVQYNLAFVDMYKNLTTLNSGIIYSGINLNTKFVSGGAFSLDGVHLNPRGYALIANYYIESINQKYGSTIPAVDVTKFSGVVFP